MVRPHYDDSVRDPLTGSKSEWTLLIYLTGVEDRVEGGEVSNPILHDNKTFVMKETLLVDYILQGREGEASSRNCTSINPRYCIAAQVSRVLDSQ
jgi:hypothetical protein